MHFSVYGIIETDTSSRRVLRFFPEEVLVTVDEKEGRLQLEPVGGSGLIPLREAVDYPELPLREGGMTIGGQAVRLVFLGRSSGEASRGRADTFVYGLKDPGQAERLKAVMPASS